MSLGTTRENSPTTTADSASTVVTTAAVSAANPEIADWEEALRKLPTGDNQESDIPNFKHLRTQLNWLYLCQDINFHLHDCNHLIPANLKFGLRKLELSRNRDAHLFDGFWPGTNVFFNPDTKSYQLYFDASYKRQKIMAVLFYARGAVVAPDVAADFLHQYPEALKEIKRILAAIDSHLDHLGQPTRYFMIPQKRQA